MAWKLYTTLCIPPKGNNPFALTFSQELSMPFSQPPPLPTPQPGVFPLVVITLYISMGFRLQRKSFHVYFTCEVPDRKFQLLFFTRHKCIHWVSQIFNNWLNLTRFPQPRRTWMGNFQCQGEKNSKYGKLRNLYAWVKFQGVYIDTFLHKAHFDFNKI